MTIELAIQTLKAAGYRVSKPKAPKVKDRVGPTFVATFSDGQSTRMSVFTSLAKLDVDRALRLSEMAYEARNRNWFALLNLTETPDICEGYFEQDGAVLAMYDFTNQQVALAA